MEVRLKIRLSKSFTRAILVDTNCHKGGKRGTLKAYR